jgi:hypothetical protein
MTDPRLLREVGDLEFICINYYFPSIYYLTAAAPRSNIPKFWKLPKNGIAPNRPFK